MQKRPKESRQKSKGKKRPKHWHRGEKESIQFERVMNEFPNLNLASTSEIAASGPVPLRGRGRTDRGDAL